MILGNCFPFRENISEKDVEKWKKELTEAGLISKICYEGRNLIAVVKWEKHQTIMNRSKRNYINNSLSIQDVINTIEGLISLSLGTNYQIEKRKEKKEKEKHIEKKEEKQTRPCGLLDVYFQFLFLGLIPEKAIKKAIEFFSYYESNGWKVGGKATMKNWRAACSGIWMKDEARLLGHHKDYMKYIVDRLISKYGESQEYNQFDFATLIKTDPELFEDEFCFNQGWINYLRGLKK
jgi:hypothetical protein